MRSTVCDSATAHLVYSETKPLHKPLLEHCLRREDDPQHDGDTMIELALGHALVQGNRRMKISHVSVDWLLTLAC